MSAVCASYLSLNDASWQSAVVRSKFRQNCESNIRCLFLSQVSGKINLVVNQDQQARTSAYPTSIFFKPPISRFSWITLEWRHSALLDLSPQAPRRRPGEPDGFYPPKKVCFPLRLCFQDQKHPVQSFLTVSLFSLSLSLYYAIILIWLRGLWREVLWRWQLHLWHQLLWLTHSTTQTCTKAPVSSTSSPSPRYSLCITLTITK